MFWQPYKHVMTVIICLCSASAALAQADSPPFSPLKLASDGRLENVNTVTMPGLADRSIPAGPLGRIVSRDLRTGEVTVREDVTREEFLSGTFRPGGDGVLTGPAVESADKNFYYWDPVPDPTVGTYPRHLKVSICWEGPCEEPFGGHCSGTLIDPMHVITAAHCVYSLGEDHPGFADEIRVIPGYENHLEPWGDAHAVQMHVWEGWSVDHDDHHDIAILDLDRPIGALVGWRSYGCQDDCDWYYGGGWVHRAYPAEDPYDGLIMFENGGSFDHCWSSYTLDWHLAAFDNPSWGGSSGVGSVRDGVVWAILRGSDRETSSDAALITSGKFAGIGIIRDEDMPSSPDLMPIYVQAEGENFAPGGQLDAFSFVLVSYANVGITTAVVCHIYMSDDANITTGDVYVDSEVVAVNLQAMSSQVVDVFPRPTVPVATTSGRYFLGVILDYNDAILSNNITAAVELDSIYVGCPLPNQPLILSPLEGAVCQPLARTIDWDDQPLIETYQLRFGTWCGETLIDVGTASQYTVSGLDNSTTYYATVRAKKYCGSWSPWSACRSFTTLDIPTSAIAFLTPTEGDICQDSTSVTIAWQPVPAATSYDLRVGESCGSGGTYPLVSTTPYHDVTGLAGDTTYNYQVRVLGACGNWGDWSACRTFSTLPGIYKVPYAPYPPEGYACMNSTVTLGWMPVEYPCTYEVEWGESCRMGAATIVTGNICALPPLAEGTWYWHVRALHVCGGVSSWSPCWSFGVDTTPPVWPTWLESPTHALSTWSNEPQVMTRWVDATDDCNVEYRVLWDHASATVPDSLIMDIMDTQYTSDPLSSGDDHWFHVLAKDMPGNLAVNPQHLGPFWIDATPPEVHVVNPVGGQVLLSSYPVTIAWTAVDPDSGVDTTAIHYTFDAGDSWHHIATLADPLVTTFAWTVPAAATDSARVRVTVTDVAGNAGQATNERWFSVGLASGAGDPLLVFSLHQNVPNPFNPMTIIRYELPAVASVSLRVFDLSGKLVRTLVAAEVPAGLHEAVWNGKDETGRQASAGVYIYRLKAGGFGETRRMTLVK